MTPIDTIHADFRNLAALEDEIALARRVVAAFEAAPGVGALAIDGKMVDITHLKAARKRLASF